MAIKELLVRISGDDSGLQKALNNAQKGLGDTVKASDNLAASMKEVGKGMSLWVTAPILGLGAAAVKSSADMEMLEASFTTMLGSAKSAASLMAEIKKMGAQTPFEVSDLANATKTLLQFGIAQKDVLPTLSMLGDISQGNSEKLKSLSVVFGQIQSTGRLMGGDLLQLINAGFNPLQEISKTTGISVAELKTQMEKGAISADMVTESFKRATSQGGQFNGGMATASKTLTGLASTMKDDLLTAGRSLVEALMPILKDTTKAISGIAQAFSALDGGTKTTILVFAGLAAAIGPVLLGASQLITAVGTIKTVMAGLSLASGGPVALAVIGLAALAAAFGTAYAGAEKAKKEYAEFQKVLKGESTGDLSRDLEIVNKKLEENAANMKKATDAAKTRGGKDGKALVDTYTKENAQLQIQKDRIVSSMRAKAQDAQAQDSISKALDDTQAALDKVNKASAALAQTSKATHEEKVDQVETEKTVTVKAEEEKKEAIEETTVAAVESGEVMVIGMEESSDAMDALTKTVKNGGDEFGLYGETAVGWFNDLDYAGVKALEDLRNGIDRNGIDSLKKLGEQMKKEKEQADITAKAFEGMGKGLVDVAGKGTLDGLKKVGEALGKGEDAGLAAANALGELGKAILNALPNLFLQAGLQLMTAETWPIGLALLAASGVSAVVSGLTAASSGAKPEDIIKATKDQKTIEERENASKAARFIYTGKTEEMEKAEKYLFEMQQAGLISTEAVFGQLTKLAADTVEDLTEEFMLTGSISSLAGYDSSTYIKILKKLREHSSTYAGLQELYTVPTPPKFASGTDWAPGGLSLVGERGPELRMLNQGDKIIPNHEMNRAVGGNTFIFNSPKALDVGEAKRVFISEQRRVAFAGGL